MIMEMSFPRGLVVEADFRNHTVRSDQPERIGGENSAPAPFDLCLASIGSCAGYYVLRFCRQRDIDTTGLTLTLESIQDSDSGRVARLFVTIGPPPGFPEKYHRALVRAVDQCAVKRALATPPDFDVQVETGREHHR
jgi:ribosomal protein S12 methylthiotransferase accessory factor